VLSFGLPVQDFEEVLLRLVGLLQHAREETARPYFSVAVRDRHLSQHPAGLVMPHPDLVIAAPRQGEAVPAEDGPELIQAWRHLLGEAAEVLEPAEDGRLEQRHVALLIA